MNGVLLAGPQEESRVLVANPVLEYLEVGKTKDWHLLEAEETK